MAKRKEVRKSDRFEVFKRDSFRCQYCGHAAPDVVLQIDHIKPVSKGGDNEITNLITSCVDCNSGKSDRELSDDAAIQKQRAQLEELNQRREQLEMMVQWREGLAEHSEQEVDAFARLFTQATDGSLNETGRANVKKWLRKFSFTELTDALDASAAQYIEYGDDGEPTQESIEKVYGYIPRIAGYRKNNGDDPVMKDLFYVRGILRNRLHYVNEGEAIRLLKEAHGNGATLDDLKDLARDVRNWTQFREAAEHFLETGEWFG